MALNLSLSPCRPTTARNSFGVKEYFQLRHPIESDVAQIDPEEAQYARVPIEDKIKSNLIIVMPVMIIRYRQLVGRWSCKLSIPTVNPKVEVTIKDVPMISS